MKTRHLATTILLIVVIVLAMIAYSNTVMHSVEPAQAAPDWTTLNVIMSGTDQQRVVYRHLSSSGNSYITRMLVYNCTYTDWNNWGIVVQVYYWPAGTTSGFPVWPREWWGPTTYALGPSIRIKSETYSIPKLVALQPCSMQAFSENQSKWIQYETVLPIIHAPYP